MNHMVHVCEGERVCAPVATHPRGHASGGEPGNVVLKVNASNPNHVHLVCWVVQGTERERNFSLFFKTQMNPVQLHPTLQHESCCQQMFHRVTTP